MSVSYGLAGKRILVAGVGGIGAVVAEQLIDEGAHLALTYRSDPERSRDLVERAEGSGSTVAVIKADYENVDEVERSVAEAIAALGGLDGLVITVGATYSLVPLLRMEPAHIERQIAVELRSIIYCVRAALPAMVEAGGGRVVIVGSDSGKAGMAGEAISAAARAGVIAFAKSIAQEHGRHGITVNVLCPGVIATSLPEKVAQSSPMAEKLMKVLESKSPLKRVGQPSEAADAVTFLLSDRASYVTGQAISVNGGMIMQ